MKEKPNVDTTIAYRLNDHNRRIRLLEEKIDRITNAISVLEESLKEVKADVKIQNDRLKSKIDEMNRSLEEVRSEIEKLNSLLEKKADKTDLAELKSFIDVLNPIKSVFVTKDELKRALENFNKLKSKDI